jgi:hypothetical protein
MRIAVVRGSFFVSGWTLIKMPDGTHNYAVFLCLVVVSHRHVMLLNETE